MGDVYPIVGYPEANRLSIANPNSPSSDEFLYSLQPVCEVFYYVLLQGFKNVVKIHAIREGHAQESTHWSEAYLSAVQTLTYAKTAAKKAASHNPEADKNGQRATHSLDQRYVMCLQRLN